MRWMNLVSNFGCVTTSLMQQDGGGTLIYVQQLTIAFSTSRLVAFDDDKCSIKF